MTAPSTVELADPENIPIPPIFRFVGDQVRCASSVCLVRHEATCHTKGQSNSGRIVARCESKYVPKGYSFDRMDIQCKGNDTHIIVDSCYFEYTLVQKGPSQPVPPLPRPNDRRQDDSTIMIIVTVFTIGLLVLVFIACVASWIPNARPPIAPAVPIYSAGSPRYYGSSCHGYEYPQPYYHYESPHSRVGDVAAGAAVGGLGGLALGYALANGRRSTRCQDRHEERSPSPPSDHEPPFHRDSGFADIHIT